MPSSLSIWRGNLSVIVEETYGIDLRAFAKQHLAAFRNITPAVGVVPLASSTSPPPSCERERALPLALQLQRETTYGEW
jgi:hypothetical protein